MNNYNQIKQLPKYLKVLNALRIGGEVKLGNVSVPYVMYKNQIGVFGVKTNTTDNSKKKIFLHCDLDLNYFIGLCEKIPDNIIIMMENNMMKCLERTENKNEND